jgi:hypothetical protein
MTIQLLQLHFLTLILLFLLPLAASILLLQPG